MKKRFSIMAATFTASCLLILSGCAGCGAQTKNIAALNSNWYANTTYKYIQPTFTEGNELFKSEKLTYKVSFDNTSASNSTYSVSYADGTYETEFYAAKFDREKLTDKEFSGSYPNELVAYCYKTELNIPSVTFKYGEGTKTFEGDKKITECWFLPVDSHLQPLYSRIECKSTTPAELQATSLENAYREVEYTYTTYYDYEGVTAKTIISGGEENETRYVDIGSSDNTVFDVASLDIAVRASKLASTLSQVVTLYAPAAGAETYGFSGSDSELGETQNTAKEILSNSGLYKPEYEKNENGEYVLDESGNKKELPLQSVAVNILYGGSLEGVSQTYWFAAINNPSNNTSRATMLRMRTPLPYGLGALDYTLQSIESTLY